MYKVSIITVSKNEIENIERTIESVVNQSYSNIEHIIIDGNSSDGTIRKIFSSSKCSNTKIVISNDQGIYDAINKGIRLASGDIIGILNANDIYANSTIVEEIVKNFNDINVDICYGDLIYTHAKDDSKIIRYWRSKQFNEGLFERGWMPPHPTFYVRKKVYDQYGLYDLSFQSHSDFELMMRFLLKKNLGVRYINKILIRMKNGGVSNRGFWRILKANKNAYRACLKNGLDIKFEYLFIIKKIISRLPQYLYSQFL